MGFVDTECFALPWPLIEDRVLVRILGILNDTTEHLMLSHASTPVATVPICVCWPHAKRLVAMDYLTL